MIAFAGGSSQTIPPIFMISGQIERIKPLSLRERVASFRPKLNLSPSGRGWPKAG